MQRTMQGMLVLTSALGAALLAAPAMARPHGQAGQAVPTDPVASLPAQQQAARGLDRSGQREAHGLLIQADQAVGRGDWARANELLERARTIRLNELAGASGPDAFDQARQAMMHRDAAAAHRALQAAMNETGGAGRADLTAHAVPGQVPEQPGAGAAPAARAEGEEPHGVMDWRPGPAVPIPPGSREGGGGSFGNGGGDGS